MIYDDDDDDRILKTSQSNFISRLIKQINNLFSLNEKDYDEVSSGKNVRASLNISRTMLARTLRAERLKQRIQNNTKRN